MIKIANNLQRLVKQANSLAAMQARIAANMVPAVGVPSQQSTQSDMQSVNPTALINPATLGRRGGGALARPGMGPAMAVMSAAPSLLRDANDMFSMHPSLMQPQQPQFTPSQAQQQFAQRAMGIPDDQAQFASPEAVRARMHERDQGHIPASSDFSHPYNLIKTYNPSPEPSPASDYPPIRRDTWGINQPTPPGVSTYNDIPKGVKRRWPERKF